MNNHRLLETEMVEVISTLSTSTPTATHLKIGELKVEK